MSDLLKKYEEVKLAAYKLGFIDGMAAYAWWKDGTQQVGTTGRTLKQAVAEVEKTWNYRPPVQS